MANFEIEHSPYPNRTVQRTKTYTAYWLYWVKFGIFLVTIFRMNWQQAQNHQKISDAKNYFKTAGGTCNETSKPLISI